MDDCMDSLDQSVVVEAEQAASSRHLLIRISHLDGK